MSEPRARLSFTERQLSVLIAAVRNKLRDYEGDLAECDPDTNQEEIDWYQERINELRPLERRINRVGSRLHSRT